MRLHRFFVDFPFEGPEGRLTNRDLIHQIEFVLRLAPGAEIVLFNNFGEEARVKLVDFTKTAVFFVVEEKKKSTKVGREVVLAAAIVKRDNFEWIVQKATEIGVSEIIPLVTHHSVKFGLQMQRLHKISIEAIEQSGQVELPKILEPMTFSEALKITEGKNKYFFDFDGAPFGQKKVRSEKPLALFVGPEGGWSDAEREEAKKTKCSISSLGSTVLRSETAATVASYLAVNS